MADRSPPEPVDDAAEFPAEAVEALSKPLWVALARMVYDATDRYPDIVDPKDRRLFENPDKPTPIPQWVYFMVDDGPGLIKVGISSEVKVRKASVGRGVGRKVALAGSVRGDFATEAAFHKALAAHRAHGEWFRRGPWFYAVLEGLDADEDADAILKRINALESTGG